MSSCKRATEARVRLKPKDNAATMNNPINSHPGKMCSCGKMCKNNRGLKIHQDKTKCQTPENNLVASPQKCFVSLQNVILSSCLTFDDSIYYRTSDNTFIPISNSEKPVAGNKCYVQMKDIIIHPLTKVLSTIKDGLVRYCNTKTSHNGVNNMWFLKNSTSLLSSLDQLDVRTATSVQTFDFSTLYISIPHDLLKSRISNLVHNAFRKKDGSVRYTHIKVTRAKGYFTHDINGGGDNMYTADNICKMIEFLIDNIFVQFGGCLFH